MKKLCKITTFSLLIIALIVIAGCSSSTTNSTNIKTSGIYATFKVEQQSDSYVNVQATLSVGNSTGTDVKLSDGERLLCNEVALRRQYNLFNYIYVATVNPSETYIFELIRNDEEPIEITAPEMPNKPTINVPSGDVTVSAHGSLNLGWDPCDYATDIIDVNFGYPVNVSLTDTQTSNTGVHDFDPLNLPTSATECDLTVKITRYLQEDVGPEFAGGYTESKIIDSKIFGCTVN